jgi:hypothetical protein
MSKTEPVNRRSILWYVVQSSPIKLHCLFGEHASHSFRVGESIARYRRQSKSMTSTSTLCNAVPCTARSMNASDYEQKLPLHLRVPPVLPEVTFIHTAPTCHYIYKVLFRYACVPWVSNIWQSPPPPKGTATSSAARCSERAYHFEHASFIRLNPCRNFHGTYNTGRVIIVKRLSLAGKQKSKKVEEFITS